MSRTELGRFIRCRRCRKRHYVWYGENVCRTCAAIRRQNAAGGCTAILWHGPGHQSRTFCEERSASHVQVGRKKLHCVRYRNGAAEWFGREAHTGYFDEPPEVNY